MLLILRWPWSSGVAAMRVWGPRPRPGLLSASGLLLCPENTAAGWSRPRPRWSAQYLIYSAIPPFLPGPPPPCTSPSYESEKGRLTLGGRQPAAGSTGQVPPPGGRPAANTLHKHMRQPRLRAEAAPEDETLVSRELDVLVKDNAQQSRRTVGRARSGKYAAELDGRSSCGGKKQNLLPSVPPAHFQPISSTPPLDVLLFLPMSSAWAGVSITWSTWRATCPQA